MARARTAPTLLVMTKLESLAHSWLRLADELEDLETVLRRLKRSEKEELARTIRNLASFSF